MVPETGNRVNELVWDLICVGSGISTLTYAAMMTRKNPALRVLVLEQHNVAGGYSSEFRRPKQAARFDCSLHKLTGMGEGGNLRVLFGELGLDGVVNLRFSPAWFDVKCDKDLLLESDPEKVHAAVLARFPHEKSGLDQYFGEIALHGRNSYMQFEILLGQFEANFKDLRYAHKHFKKTSVLDALKERFSDPRLIEILSLPAIYIGAFPEQCAYLYYLHVVYASLHRRSAYIKGGSQYLSNLLVQQIVQRNGKLMLNVEVEKVLVDEQTQEARGVITDKGTFLGKSVLINAAPLYAVRNFFAPSPELESCASRLDAQAPANSTTTIYLVLRDSPQNVGLPHAESMVLSDDPQAARRLREAARSDPSNPDLAEAAYWHNSSFEVTNYHVLDETGGKVVIVNALDDIRHWPERKTPEYRAKKNRAAYVLLTRLYAVCPELERHVAYVEVSSPRTYQRYTNNTAGSGYGALVSPDATPSLINNNFPVRNVTFLSAWVSGSGYEATMGYSRMLASLKSVHKSDIGKH